MTRISIISWVHAVAAPTCKAHRGKCSESLVSNLYNMVKSIDVFEFICSKTLLECDTAVLL